MYDFLSSTVATVFAVYGIETWIIHSQCKSNIVATVLTVYGIETHNCQDILCHLHGCNSTYRYDMCATDGEVEAAQRNDEILYIAVIYTD